MRQKEINYNLIDKIRKIVNISNLTYDDIDYYTNGFEEFYAQILFEHFCITDFDTENKQQVLLNHIIQLWKDKHGAYNDFSGEWFQTDDVQCPNWFDDFRRIIEIEDGQIQKPKYVLSNANGEKNPLEYIMELSDNFTEMYGRFTWILESLEYIAEGVHPCIDVEKRYSNSVGVITERLLELEAQKDEFEQIDKLKDQISVLKEKINNNKTKDENYYFCDFAVRYMNSNRNKSVSKRKTVRDSIMDIMTQLKLSLPREVQEKLNEFDDENTIPQKVEYNFYASVTNNGTLTGNVNKK